MAITESLGALGNWSISLREDTPREIRDRIKYFGHVTIHTGRVEPALVGDGLLGSSRYTGVLRGKGEGDEGFDLVGCGMEFWLGDEDDKGVVIEHPKILAGLPYTSAIADLLDDTTAVVAGTLHPQIGTFTGTFQFIVLRKAIKYVADTGGHEYRVNGDATVDYGAVDELYVTDPKCLVVKRGSGVDMDLRALLGKSDVDSDVEDFTTRVVLLAASTDTQIATGDADIAPGLNPYKDRFGNPIKLTRMVSESTTDATNADVRAQLQLNRFSSTRDALSLSTEDYDINGSARVGDYLWVFNPDVGLYDVANEVTFRGETMNPVKLRLIETTWPVSPGFMVAYRDPDGAWLDLTDYVKWESGQTTVMVGGYNRSLTGAGSEPIGRLPQPDASVPDVIAWVEPFTMGVYQSAVTGQARGDVRLTWLQPSNTDATPIVDGSHYEIRYRQSTIPAYPVTWDMLEALGYSWDDLEATGATWDSPILFPETAWQFAVAPFDVQTFRIQELVPAMPYEVQIRAVDLATPPNVGVWSDLAVFQTTRDDIPPATPAAPVIAASTLAVQMTHHLGVASGGTFNLDRDLHHLELYGGSEPLFTPDDSNRLGKVLATWGMMITEVPVVQTFPLDNLNPVYFKVIAVDEAGNKSLPSSWVKTTAELVDDAHISNLTVSKVTAGNITADWFVGSDITGGALHVIGEAGIDVTGGGDVKIHDGALIVYNANGNKIVELGECADGRHGLQVYKDNGTRVARVGELSSGSEGIEIINDLGTLVRLDTLAFGTQAGSVSAFETTASAAFTNLATVGPSATVTLGNSQRCIVIVSGTLLSDIDGANAFMGFEYSGPGGTNPADEFRSLTLFSSNFTGIASSKAFLASPIAPAGNWTFTAKYKASGGTVQFGNRHIIVIPF